MRTAELADPQRAVIAHISSIAVALVVGAADAMGGASVGTLGEGGERGEREFDQEDRHLDR